MVLHKCGGLRGSSDKPLRDRLFILDYVPVRNNSPISPTIGVPREVWYQDRRATSLGGCENTRRESPRFFGPTSFASELWPPMNSQ